MSPNGSTMPASLRVQSISPVLCAHGVPAGRPRTIFVRSSLPSSTSIIARQLAGDAIVGIPSRAPRSIAYSSVAVSLGVRTFSLRRHAGTMSAKWRASREPVIPASRIVALTVSIPNAVISVFEAALSLTSIIASHQRVDRPGPAGRRAGEHVGAADQIGRARAHRVRAVSPCPRRTRGRRSPGSRA